MKKLLLTALLAVLGITCLMAAPPFNPDLYTADTIVAGFTVEAVGNNDGIMNYNMFNGRVKIGDPDFDEISQQFGFVEINPFFDFVKNKNWTSSRYSRPLHLQNIFYIKLENSEKIEKAVEALEKCSAIIYAEYETINYRRFVPNDPDYDRLYFLNITKTIQAWDYVRTEGQVVIGITDSGVQWNHPDLRNNIYINEAEMQGISIDWNNGIITGGDGIDNDGNGKVDDVLGYDFYASAPNGGYDNNPFQNFPGNEHGTHVAGCAAAETNNLIGASGSSFNAKILSCKGAPDNEETRHVANGYQQIRYCADTGADIINASWGGPGSGGTANATVDYATDEGSLVVAAAGNDNTIHNSQYQDYPSDATNALCVAATNINDTKASFSDYGEPIDISAPGDGIYSTVIQNGYESLSGTSMASPVAAGICALVKTKFPEYTPMQLRQRVMDKADNIDAQNLEYAGYLGTGRINAFAALMSDEIPELLLFGQETSEIAGDNDGLLNPGDTFELKLNILNSYGWLNAENVSATLSCDLPGVIIEDGSANFPNIVHGSVQMNNNDVFVVRTTTEVPSLTIPLKATFTADSAIENYSTVIDFEVDLTYSMQGWPISLDAAPSSPLIIDINQDGVKELVFSTTDGYVHALKVNGTEELPGFPVQVGSSMTVAAAVAVGDINPSAGLEIVAVTNDNKIVAVKADGTELFTYNGPSQFRSCPVIIDADRNGTKEIIAISLTGTVVVLNADGTDYPNFPVQASGVSFGSISVADLNGDTKGEIITASLSGLKAFDITTGANIFANSIPLGGQSPKGAAVGNIDDDADYEIVVGTSSGDIKAYDHDGSIKFTYPLGGSINSGIVICDANYDGFNEIITCNSTGKLVVLNGEGTPFANFPMELGSGVEATPIVADLNNDNLSEIIVPDTDSKLHAVNLNATNYPAFPIGLRAGSKVAAYIGSFDTDNDPEIVVSDNEGISIIDFKSRITNYPVVKCYRSNPERANSFSVITDAEDNTNNDVVPVTTLVGNYPNPFNPSTTIAYTLAEASDVELTVFNIKGQKIATLVNKHEAAGSKFVSWDASKHGSGIFFYRLKTKNKIEVKKMLMLK